MRICASFIVILPSIFSSDASVQEHDGSGGQESEKEVQRQEVCGGLLLHSQCMLNVKRFLVVFLQQLQRLFTGNTAFLCLLLCFLFHRLVLFASDELTGLIWSCALMRPSRSTMDLEVKSLKKMALSGSDSFRYSLNGSLSISPPHFFLFLPWKRIFPYRRNTFRNSIFIFSQWVYFHPPQAFSGNI